MEHVTIWNHLSAAVSCYRFSRTYFAHSLHPSIFGPCSSNQLWVNTSTAVFDMETDTRVHGDTDWELYIACEAELQGLCVMKCFFLFPHIFLFFGSNPGKFGPFAPGDWINEYMHWKIQRKCILQRFSSCSSVSRWLYYLCASANWRSELKVHIVQFTGFL